MDVCYFWFLRLLWETHTTGAGAQRRLHADTHNPQSMCLCVHRQGEAAGYPPIFAVRERLLPPFTPPCFRSQYQRLCSPPPPTPPPALEHLSYENKGKQNSADAKKKEDGKGTQ